MNVARLTRSKLGKTLSFNRVRKQTFKALFDRQFNMYPNRAMFGIPILEGVMSDIRDLRKSIQNLSTTTKNERQQYVDSKFQIMNATVDRLQTSVNSQFQSIRSDVSRQITGVQNKLTILQDKPTTPRCQLCFYVYTSTNCYYYNSASSSQEDKYCTGTTSYYDSYGSWSAPYSPGNGHYYVCWMQFKISCS